MITTTARLPWPPIYWQDYLAIAIMVTWLAYWIWYLWHKGDKW